MTEISDTLMSIEEAEEPNVKNILPLRESKIITNKSQFISLYIYRQICNENIERNFFWH